MKKVKVEKFKANDGSLHDTEAECLKHETQTEPLGVRLIQALNNSPSVVQGAMAYRENARVAAALIEECAKICAAARVAGGGAKRKTKPKEMPVVPPQVGEAKPTSLDDVKREFDNVNSSGAVPFISTSSFPTKDDPFPAHRRATGAESASGFDGPTAAE